LWLNSRLTIGACGCAAVLSGHCCSSQWVMPQVVCYHLVTAILLLALFAPGLPEPSNDGTAVASGPQTLPSGAQECWMGALTYESCCLPLPGGNPMCWDAYFTPARCCHVVSSEALNAKGADPPLTPTLEWQWLGGPGGFGGCEMSFYQRFKGRAMSWYAKHQASLALFHEFSSLVNNFHGVLESCAPAALTAILLKLEAVYFEDDTKWADLLDIYLKSEHGAVAGGTLQQKHFMNGWPIQQGLQRILGLRELGRQKRPSGGIAACGIAAAVLDGAPTMAADNPPVVVDIVICYCAERLPWLKAFHKLPWRDGDRSSTVREHVGLRIYHKCGDISDAKRNAERQRLVNEWGTYFRTLEVRFVDDAVRADDCSAYLAYIVDRYHNLPEFTFFLHADAPEHIPSLELLMDILFAGARGYLADEVGFVHLAHNFVLHELGCRGRGAEHVERVCDAQVLDSFEFPTLWREVFGSSIVPVLAAGDLNAYCCVQFLVRRSRIHLRPHHFYKHALEYFREAKSYHRLFPAGQVVWSRDIVGRTPCQLAMYIWHAMFGEPLRLPRRGLDPNLPLFMKLQNIEVEALNEETGGQVDPEIEHMITTSLRMEAGPYSTYHRVNSLFPTATAHAADAG